MTNKEISLYIIEACKASDELNDYFRATYGKDVTYCRGLNLERDEYDENEYEYVPMILIDSIQNTRGESNDRLISTLGIQTKIRHTDGFKPIVPVDNVLTYAGIDEIEHINELIIKAIEAHEQLKCLDIEDIDSYADPVRFTSNSTEYNGFIHINFEKQETIGCR
jgi:hypothetical protein